MIDKKEVQQRIVETVDLVHGAKPLAPSITNSVTINFVANAQLAVGGTAAMVYLPDEGVAMAHVGGAMYINVGTLLPIYMDAVPATMQALQELHKPWVLDPVAVGMGNMRTALLTKAKQYKPSIIRGNASEIIALAGLWALQGGTDTSDVRGVDSTDFVKSAQTAAVALATYTSGAVAVSGETDLITDGTVIAYSHGGSAMMAAVTGSGCSLGGVMAVYAAVTTPFIAALTGTAAYNVAGERAAAKAGGTGSFQMHFLDALYNLTANDSSQNGFDLQEV